MDNSKIEWTDTTWNPVSGCTKVSPGCAHCYAEEVTRRWPNNYPNGFAVTLKPERLEDPLKWKRPRRIFVNSMSDLFHEDVPDQFIADVFNVMVRASHHTFQVLTKRSERMRDFAEKHLLLPPLNVWLGVSVENDKTSRRIRDLVATPAHRRFISFEPLIAPIDWVGLDLFSTSWRDRFVHWAIFGGESGPKARPLDLDWIYDGLTWCRENEVAPFVKQLGTVWARTNRAKHSKGGDMAEWPADLRVREYPAP